MCATNWFIRRYAMTNFDRGALYIILIIVIILLLKHYGL